MIQQMQAVCDAAQTDASETKAPAASHTIVVVGTPLDMPVDTVAGWSTNYFPTLTTAYRIAIIGDYPTADAHHQRTPFVGQEGKLINGMLSKAGVLREACFLGYPGPTLRDDLVRYAPNIVILFGKMNLLAAKGTANLDSYRGSLFIGQGVFHNLKCIATWSPADCWKAYDRTGYMWFDLCKALSEAHEPTLSLPQRDIQINYTHDQLIDELRRVQEAKLPISVDLEGYWNNLSCCSIATGPDYAFIVPFCNLDSSHYWPDEDQELSVWRAFAALMTDADVPKIFQNGLYDRFVLQYGFNITVQGNTDDTMLKWAEKWCEMEKGLGVQASILTKEPYWKFERKSSTKEQYYTYCCKDSAVTYELNSKMTRMLDAAQHDHYTLNVALLNPILYMEIRGINYDTQESKNRLKEINHHVHTYQYRLDALAHVGARYYNNREELNAAIRATCCTKKKTDTFKKAYQPYAARLTRIMAGTAPLTAEESGFINLACGWGMNIKSDMFKTFLYDTLKLPKQHDHKTKALTTNYEALLKISKKSPHEAVEIALELGELRTRSQMLAIHADDDGRVRCGYNIVGTETGRITCYTSPTGSGYNLQTIPDSNALKPPGHALRSGLRDLFKSDDGCYMFQCDLSGADGWTVGAHLAALGDPMMLDDLRYGIKPAARICYMLRHGNDSLRGKERDEVKHLLKEISKDSWDYFACKGGIWGTCYTMGPRKLSDHIFVQSEGKVNFSEKDAKGFQQAVFSVYNVHLWHRWMERHLAKKPELVSPNGHRRRFFGRSTEILSQALAHEPQVNTTYATNLAAYKLWTDPQNRCVPQSGRTLRIEPLHQVHDALLGQFRIEDTAFAVERIKTYFQNEIIIAGIPITIPFSGSYGTSWGNLNQGDIK